MKNPQLLASGLILLGIVFLVSGIYLFAAGTSETTDSLPAVTSTPYTYVQPQNSSNQNSQKNITGKSKAGANIQQAVNLSNPVQPNTNNQRQAQVAEKRSVSVSESNKTAETPPYPAKIRHPRYGLTMCIFR